MPSDDEAISAQGSENENQEENAQEAPEYVKKEFVAKPYVSPYGTENEVASITPKNTR
jgi:hypothetical protein